MAWRIGAKSAAACTSGGLRLPRPWTINMAAVLFVAGSLAAAHGDAVPHRPVMFEQNAGQWQTKAQFGVRTAAGLVLLEPSRITARSACGDATLRFQNAQRAARMAGQRQVSTSHYFLGSDPGAWRTNVPSFERVRTTGLLRGIDVEYYGRDGEIEFDFLLQPGRRPEEIVLEVSADNGMRIDSSGELVIRTCDGELRLRKPVSWQEHDLERRPVDVRYTVIDRSRVRLATSSTIDPALPLLIDPVISFLTYFGGDKSEGVTSMGRDAQGNIYISGATESLSLPGSATNKGARSAADWNDGFVTKLSPRGDAIIWTTWIGGSANETVVLAVGPEGKPVIGGYTRSTDFPVTENAMQKILGGSFDAFVGRLRAAGDGFDFLTYFGGVGEDTGSSVAISPEGSIVLAGGTYSSSLLSSPLLPMSGSGDAFIAKFAADGSRVVASTYFGATAHLDGANGLAVAPDGNIYIAGYTGDGAVPVKNAFQSSRRGGTEGYVAGFNGALTELLFASYFGGNAHDRLHKLAADDHGLLVAGDTASGDLPVKNAVQTALSGPRDMYVARFDHNMAELRFATYFGGSGSEELGDIDTDASGNVWLVGNTSSTDLPLLSPLNTQLAGPIDSTVVKLTPAGMLAFSTYLGGQGGETLYAVDASTGPVIVAGATSSADLPVRNAAQPGFAGGGDVFIAALGEDFTGSGEERILPVVASSPGAEGSFFRTTVQLHNPHASEIGGRFVFHRQGESGTAADPSLSFFIGPGQTVSFRDVLQALGRDGVGSIDMVTLPGAAPVAVARIFNDAGDLGTTGMSHAAMDPAASLQQGEKAVLLVPSDLVKARFNIGVRTLAAGLVLDLTVRRADGGVAHTLQKSWPPHYFVQTTAEAFMGVPPQANDSLEIVVAGGSGIIYGAATDNTTQDPTMQVAQRIGLPRQRSIVPVVASARGDFGSFFRTEVQIHNPSDQAARVRFVYTPANNSGPATEIEETLSPRQTRSWADFLPAFSLDGLGSMDVIPAAATSDPLLAVRIYNDAGAAGTTGMATGALPESGAAVAGGEVVLLAPPDTLSSRFNIGIRTLGAGARVNWRLRNRAGAVLHTGTLTFPAEFFTQQSASALLGLPIGDNDSIAFSVDEGSLFIYGAATDNVTQDPSLQLATGR
jgi:hypothetical protein